MVHEKVVTWSSDCQDWLWLERSQSPTVINETYKDSKRQGRGAQVIDEQARYSVAKGTWKDFQDNLREVQHDFDDIPISERAT
jgi:hypothetical protein